MTNREYTDESLIAALKASHNESLSDDAKARMLATIEASVNPVTAPPPPVVRRVSSFSFSTMIPALVVILVLVLGTGTAVAADRAKPGDRLFGLDRAIEWTRLKLAVSGEAKAQIAAAIADERQREADLLAQKGRDEARREAEQQSDAALEQAQLTVAQVRAKLETKKNAKAVEALKKVEDKLSDLRARRADDDDGDDDAGLTEAEVKLFGAYALIKFEQNDEKSSYRMETTDRNAILSDIAKRTGLSTAALKALVKFETEDGDDNEDKENDRANVNRNGNANQNENENRNRNTTQNTNTTNRNRNDDDDNENENVNRIPNPPEIDQWKIEVRVGNGRAEIKTEFAGQNHQEWTLQTTDRAVILAEITARTGLTPAEVETMWDYEVED